jgi:hypothetical protein
MGCIETKMVTIIIIITLNETLRRLFKVLCSFCSENISEAMTHLIPQDVRSSNWIIYYWCKKSIYWKSKYLPMQPGGCIFDSICLIYICIMILLSVQSCYLYNNNVFFQETDLTPMLRCLTDAVCRTFPLSRYTSVTRSEKLQAFVANHLPRSVYDIIYTWTHFQNSDNAFIHNNGIYIYTIRQCN